MSDLRTIITDDDGDGMYDDVHVVTVMEEDSSSTTYYPHHHHHSSSDTSSPSSFFSFKFLGKAILVLFILSIVFKLGLLIVSLFV